jgi:tape measure domain-containing protein
LAERVVKITILGNEKSGVAALKATGNAAGGLEAKLSGLTGVVSKTGGMLGSVLGGIAITGGAAVVGLGAAAVKAGVDFNSMYQQAQIGFTTMLGSAEKAESFLQGLQGFAASTPFEFPELVGASQKMLAFGFSAEEVIPMLTDIGDAVAGLGGNAELVGRVTMALGQMQAKGKASGEEMMQLAEAGIPAWQYLAEAIGTDIPTAMKMVENGAVDAEKVIGAVRAGMHKDFGGMMAAQSNSWAGLLSTIKDTFSQAAGKVMKPLFAALTDGAKGLVAVTSSAGFQDFVTRLASGMGKVVEMAKTWGPPIIAAVGDVLGALQRFGSYAASAIGAVVDAFQKLRNGEITLAQFIGGVKNLIATVFKDLFNQSAYGDAGSAIIGPIINGIRAALPIVVNELMILGRAFGEWVTTVAVPWLQINLPIWLTTLGTWLTGTALPAIGGFLLAIGQAFGTWITETAVPFLQANLPVWLSALGTWLSGTALPAVGEALVTIGQKFGTWITETAVPYLQENVPIWLAALSDWLTGTVFPAVVDALTTIGEQFGTWIIETAVPFLMDNVPVWLSSLVDWLSNTALPAVRAGLITIGEKFGDFITEKAVPYLLEKIPEWLTALGDFLLNTALPAIGAKALEIGKALVDKFMEEANKLKGQVTTAMGEIPGAITTGIGDLTGLLVQKGKDLVQGLIDGMASLLGAVQNKAAELARAAANAVASALGIKSPSTVMIEYGENIGQGLVLGMAGQESGVIGMANRLARGIEAAFTGGVPGGSDVVGMATRMAQGIGAAFAGGGGSVGYNAAGDLDRFELNGQATETAQARINRWTGDNMRDYGMDAENARFAALARLKRDYERTGADWRGSGFDLANIRALDTEKPQAGRNYGPGAGPQSAVWRNTGTDRWELLAGGGAGAGFGATIVNVTVQGNIYNTEQMENVVVNAITTAQSRGRL